MIGGFENSDFDGANGKLSTTVTFIVEKDGSISQIKTDGKDVLFNKETERAIRSIKGKWTPAKVDGQSVRSYFKFPVSMVFVLYFL